MLFEDSALRDRAALTLDRLATKLGTELEFEVEQWRFDSLPDPHFAWDATESAVHADAIVFAMHDGHDAPATIRNWVETWADSREVESGAIVGMIGLQGSPAAWVSPRHHFLRHLAERAHMDYLPEGFFNPDEVSAAAMHKIIEKTDAVTTVLKEILDHPHYTLH